MSKIKLIGIVVLTCIITTGCNRVLKNNNYGVYWEPTHYTYDELNSMLLGRNMNEETDEHSLYCYNLALGFLENEENFKDYKIDTYSSMIFSNGMKHYTLYIIPNGFEKWFMDETDPMDNAVIAVSFQDIPEDYQYAQSDYLGFKTTLLWRDDLESAIANTVANCDITYNYGGIGGESSSTTNEYIRDGNWDEYFKHENLTYITNRINIILPIGMSESDIDNIYRDLESVLKEHYITDVTFLVYDTEYNRASAVQNQKWTSNYHTSDSGLLARRSYKIDIR